MNVRKHAAVLSGDDLSLKSGDASILAKKDGEIAINGKDTSIEASGKVNCKAAGDLILSGGKSSAKLSENARQIWP